MDADDIPVGRLLSRREMLELLGVAGAISLTGMNPRPAWASPPAGFPACVVRPELIEGPYFVDKMANRADLRTEPGVNGLAPGARLDLTFNVSSVVGTNGTSCAPLAGAVVDLWACDAQGVYSGVNDRIVGFNTVGKTVLRGYQLTDAAGAARFTTIYPGWYQGRAVHLHFKIRTTTSEKAAYEFTSQLFFDDVVSDELFKTAPYKRPGARDTRNANDMFFRQAGDQLLLALEKKGADFQGAFNVGLDLSNAAVGRADGGRAGGRGRGGPPPDGRSGGPPGGRPRGRPRGLSGRGQKGIRPPGFVRPRLRAPPLGPRMGVKGITVCILRP